MNDAKDSTIQVKQLKRAKDPNKKKMLLYFVASLLSCASSPLTLLDIKQPERETSQERRRQESEKRDPT
jgi:hypothetical protein